MTGRTRVALALCVLTAGGRSVADDGTARVIVSTGSSAMPSWTADGSHLVFHSRRKEAKQHGIAARNIWIVGADGSGERQLTKGTKDEYHPVVSPDGKKLLFVSELNGSTSFRPGSETSSILYYGRCWRDCLPKLRQCPGKGWRSAANPARMHRSGASILRFRSIRSLLLEAWPRSHMPAGERQGCTRGRHWARPALGKTPRRHATRLLACRRGARRDRPRPSRLVMRLAAAHRADHSPRTDRALSPGHGSPTTVYLLTETAAEHRLSG